MIPALAVWNASLIELLWTAIGLIGLYFNRYNLIDTRKYAEAVEKLNGNNLTGFRLMRIIAAGHFRNELFRLVFSLTVIAIGVIASITPPPRNAPPSVTTTGVTITFGLFVLVMLGSVIPSVLDKKQRQLMGRIGDAEEAASPAEHT